MSKRDRPRAGERRWRSRLGADGGFTLIEALMAAVVLVVGLVTLLGLLDTSLKASAATKAREGATNLARQVLEDARTIPFSQLSPSSVVAELQEQHELADASGEAGWQVVQRGVTYTVAVSECSIDDPKDGYGVHENKETKENPFCSESSTTGTSDTQPEDFKRITVDVTWKATGRKPDVHMVETLTAAGEAPGLAASGLHLSSPETLAGKKLTLTEPVISEEPAGEKLVFAVTAPSATVSMRWSLEGVAQSTPPTKSSGTTWTFSWSIPYPTVSDGTYTVSAQAIDATGVVGPPVSMPVTLIRGVPAAVKGLKGGFNTINVSGSSAKVVELEWKANSERNVIGYRVWYEKSELVCPSGGTSVLSVAVTCIDFKEGREPEPTSSKRTFEAGALYRNAEGELKEGPRGALTVAGSPVLQPNPPAELKLTKEQDGSVKLEWPKSSGSPEATFYRIYRGSANYTSRYDTATLCGASTCSYTDTDAVTTHTYWITAVDENLTESSFVGPVEG